jgi:hypothetical protein
MVTVELFRCPPEVRLGTQVNALSTTRRFVARSKERDSVLRTFMKEAGGVNACANLYAKHFGRGRRRPDWPHWPDSPEH